MKKGDPAHCNGKASMIPNDVQESLLLRDNPLCGADSSSYPERPSKDQLGPPATDAMDFMLPQYNGNSDRVIDMGNFHHERVTKVDAYTIFQYKRRHCEVLTKDELSVLQHCMVEVSKVQPQSSLYDMELEVYTESKGGSNFGFVSGSGSNRFVAIYNEYKEPDFVWVNKTLVTRCCLFPWRYIMYAFLVLLLLTAMMFAAKIILLPDAWFKAYLEGMVTVRNVVLDAKSDPYSQGMGPMFKGDKSQITFNYPL